MGIRNDAGELLRYIYTEYISDNKYIQTQDVIGRFHNWEHGRINRAIDFLRDMDRKPIKIKLFMGNTEGVYNFIITGVTPFGIRLMEDDEQSREFFG